ncbi:hypothetical protein JCM10212_006172 [Sporobolomyces blumeae]
MHRDTPPPGLYSNARTVLIWIAEEVRNHARLGNAHFAAEVIWDPPVGHLGPGVSVAQQTLDPDNPVVFHHVRSLGSGSLSRRSTPLETGHFSRSFSLSLSHGASGRISLRMAQRVGYVGRAAREGGYEL